MTPKLQITCINLYIKLFLRKICALKCHDYSHIVSNTYYAYETGAENDENGGRNINR